MASRSDIDRLKQLPSMTGRVISESGDVVNNASYLSSEVFSSSHLMSVRGRLFFSTPRVSIPAGGTASISVQISPNKYFVQYQREITVESAKWNAQNVIGGSITGGTSQLISNGYTASTNINESSVIVNPVLAGGVITQELMIPAGERKSSGVIGSGTSSVVIYPPGELATIILSHNDTQPREAQVIYEFAELTQAEFDSIQDVFIG